MKIYNGASKKEIECEQNYKMITKIPKIEDSFEKLDAYPSVTERYYTKYFYVSDHSPRDEHHCVLLHSNKICLVTLAPSHPIIKEKKKIAKLDFQVSNKLDRLENKVKGKGKKGGQNIQPDSMLCFVECEDGSKYSIYGCVKGKLIEINQLLLSDNNLLVEKPLSSGFIAIILPSKNDVSCIIEKLITNENYENDVLGCI